MTNATLDRQTKNAKRYSCLSAFPLTEKVYTHAPGNDDFFFPDDEPFILHTENPATKAVTNDYYIADALGSITELVSKDGSVSGELAYNSFGKIVYSSGNALDQPYSYTAREFDQEVALYYLRARYYDRESGRFLQPDRRNRITISLTKPNAQEGQLNKYLYVLDNPVNLIDPTGLDPLICAIIKAGIKFFESALQKTPTAAAREQINAALVSLNAQYVINECGGPFSSGSSSSGGSSFPPPIAERLLRLMFIELVVTIQVVMMLSLLSRGAFAFR